MNYYVPQESAPIGGIEKLDSMANDVREPRACFLREVGVDVHYVRHVPGCMNFSYSEIIVSLLET